MSYARKGPDSDVYVFTDGEQWHCHGCALGAPPAWDTATDPPELIGLRSLPSPAAMLEHLEEHRSVGHRVPDAAIDRLRAEAGALAPN